MEQEASSNHVVKEAPGNINFRCSSEILAYNIRIMYRIVVTLWTHTQKEVFRCFNFIKKEKRHNTTKKGRTSEIDNAPLQDRSTDIESHHQTADLMSSQNRYSSSSVPHVHFQLQYLQTISEATLFSQPQQQQIQSTIHFLYQTAPLPPFSIS